MNNIGTAVLGVLTLRRWRTKKVFAQPGDSIQQAVDAGRGYRRTVVVLGQGVYRTEDATVMPPHTKLQGPDVQPATRVRSAAKAALAQIEKNLGSLRGEK